MIVYRYKNNKYSIRGHEKYRKYIKVQKFMKEYVIEHEKHMEVQYMKIIGKYSI